MQRLPLSTDPPLQRGLSYTDEQSDGYRWIYTSLLFLPIPRPRVASYTAAVLFPSLCLLTDLGSLLNKALSLLPSCYPAVWTISLITFVISAISVSFSPIMYPSALSLGAWCGRRNATHPRRDKDPLGYRTTSVGQFRNEGSLWFQRTLPPTPLHPHSQTDHWIWLLNCLCRYSYVGIPWLIRT